MHHKARQNIAHQSDGVARAIVAWALLGFVLQLLLWLFEIRNWPLSGDERFYFECARHIRKILSGLIAGDYTRIPMHRDAIVADGWFLPGMPLLLQPALYFGWGLAQTRLYLLLINFALTLAIALRLAKCLPAAASLMWLSMMLLFPGTILFAGTLWGEAIGGKLYLLLLIELYLGLERGEARQKVILPVLVGLALGAIIYIRPNFIILSPLPVFGFFYHQRQLSRLKQAVVQTARFGLIAAFVAGITLLPWQYAMYQKFGAFFVTTTSVDLNAIVAYTDKNYESDVVYPDGKNLRRFARTHMQISTELREQAKQSGKGYGYALREERKRVLDKLTWSRYLEITASSLQDFFCNENEFLFRFQKFSINEGIKNVLYPFLLTLNTVLWYILLLATLAVFFIPLKSPAGKWFSTTLKLSLLLLWIQPFISLSSGRYMVAFIPWMVLLVSLHITFYIGCNHTLPGFLHRLIRFRQNQRYQHR
jgi:hypothetical protein